MNREKNRKKLHPCCRTRRESGGMVTSKTETDWVVKVQDGNSQTVRISTIKSKKMIPNSLMLNGFHEAMSEQELADLVAYLMTLKKKG